MKVRLLQNCGSDCCWRDANSNGDFPYYSYKLNILRSAVNKDFCMIFILSNY